MLAAEAQPSVLVVLDDHEPVLLGQFGRGADGVPGPASPRSGWRSWRTRYTSFGRTPRGQQVGELGGVHPVVRRTARRQSEPGGRDGPECPDVGRALDHGDVTWVEQHPAEQVDRLLRAGGDDEVVRGHGPADERADPVGDEGAQPGIALRRGVLQAGEVAFGHQLGGDVADLGERKRLGGRQAAGRARAEAGSGRAQQLAQRARDASTRRVPPATSDRSSCSPILRPSRHRKSFLRL